MTIKLSLVVLFLTAFCVGASAQSVVITRKKVTYTRPKPLSDYKKTFTITYPKVKAATPAISRKIEKAISPDINIKEEKTEIQWLDEADFAIDYNEHGVLSVALTTSGSAAYPSGDTEHIVVDLKTGNRLRTADVFTDLVGLLKKVRGAQDKEVTQAAIDIRKDPDNGDIDVAELFREGYKYHPLKLDDFSVGKNGVTFYHDYGFPHVALALQPPGEFLFTWEQLKPFIRSGGLLARFVR